MNSRLDLEAIGPFEASKNGHPLMGHLAGQVVLVVTAPLPLALLPHQVCRYC